MIFYFECCAEGWQHYESEAWGPCRRLIEVQEDQFASRQIDIYRSGQRLRYERASHRADRYGRLIGLRFSRKDKWRQHFVNPRQLTAQEFEREWRRSLCAPRREFP